MAGAGGSAGVGGAASGAGGGGGALAGAGGTSAGTSGTTGSGGSAGASGGQAGDGSGGASGTGTGGAGAANGGAGAGGKGGAGAGGAGASSGGKGGTGVGGALMELANGRPTTADSEETSQSNLAANGNDGMTGTRWCAADGAPHHWQVDLGAVHLLQRIEIEFEYPSQADGESYAYVVTVSNDGTTFSPGLDQSANTQTTAMQSAMFPANISGRHVRVDITPPSTTPNPTWASFWELRIYGY
jgi:hypothetical protein